MIFEFDDCMIDSSRQELWRDGRPVRVEPQVLAVLEYLAEHHDRVVTKIELLDEVWGDRFVSESALTSRIKLARRACGDNGRDQRIVRTVHSRGYRMVAPVNRRDRTDVSAPPVEPAPPITPITPITPIMTIAPTAIAPTARRTGSVVGRDDELDRLHAVLDRTVAGDGRAVLVRGSLGIGKSALIAEFLEGHDRFADTVVATGRCIRTRSAGEPFFPVLDALTDLARSEPALVAGVLERVAPSWLAQLPAIVDAATFERLERRLLGVSPARMLREGAGILDALASAHPLVVVIEDVHLADDCTLDLLDVVLGRTGSSRVMTVLTARPDVEAVDHLVATAAGLVEVVDLQPLDPSGVAALVSDRFDGAAVAASVADAVARRSGGVPLFADELVAAWRRHGQIVVDDGTVIAVTDELDRTVPPSLAPLISRELAMLDPDLVAVFDACAVAGADVDAATLAAALDLEVRRVEDALAEVARRTGAIVATGARVRPDGSVSAAYEFAHDLYRDLVYERIASARRSALHRSIAASLEHAYAGRTDGLATVLAHHFTEAGDLVRAAGHRAVVGEHACSRDAPDVAVELLTTTLDELARVSPSADRDAAERSVRMALGPALVATRGWFDRSVPANYERALELCGHEPTCPDAAAARYALATVSELQGQFERTESLLTPLLAEESDGHLALEAHELVACSTFHQGAFDRSLANSSAVLEHWDEDTYSVLMARIAEHPASSCSAWSALASWAIGRSDESLRLAERAVELGERNRYALSTAIQQRAMLHQLRAEPELCIEWSDRCRHIGEEQEFPMRTIQADIYAGWAYGATGDPERGIALLADGLARFRAAGATLNEAYYLGMYADTLLAAGDASGALRLLDEARHRSTSRSYFYEAELWRLAARAHHASGARDAAVEALDTSASIADRQGAVALALRTAVDAVELTGEASWRRRLTELLSIYADQRPTPTTLRAAAALAA